MWLAALLAMAGAGNDCAPGVSLSYVCDVEHPEDVIAIPGTRWLIASGFAPGAGLKLVDADRHVAERWYDGSAAQLDPDRAAYPSCPGPVDPKLFNARGLSLRKGTDGRYTLYVVNHGGRESIEIFDVLVDGDRPALRWRGCRLMPPGQVGNAVAAFADGTLLVTVLTRPGTTIAVTIPHARRLAPQPGLVVHRQRRMPWSGGGLRAVDAEEAVICLVAEARSDDALVGLVCDAVRGGARPDVLVQRAGRRRALRHRGLLRDVLGAVDDGVESPLEFRYRRDVERAHGLPRATAQKRELVGGRWIRADRVYEGLGVRVELDGQLAHPFGATDDDAWRDNAVLLTSGDATFRYRWRHVAVTPCDVAVQVVTALHARGWRGTPRPCGPRCPLVGLAAGKNCHAR